MKIWSALFAEFKGVFGKAYLLAGLLPAAALMIGKAWFDTQNDLASLFTTLITQGAATVPELMGSATVTLLLGLAFFAARSLLVSFVQTLPGRFLKHLRHGLIRRQVKSRVAAANRGEKHSHTCTVLEWALEREFEEPIFLPPQETPPPQDKVLTNSKQARATVEQLIQTIGWQPIAVPGRRQAKTIVRGLKLLYAYAKNNYREINCQQELQAWKSACTPQFRKVLKIVAAAAYRDYAQTVHKFDDFPDPKWIRPTMLGTRASALDDYAEKRYKIDTSTLLTRLSGVLSDEERTGLSDARLSIEVLVNLAFANLILTGWVALENALATWEYWLSPQLNFSPRTALFVTIPVLLALLFYRAAVFGYRAFGEKVIRNVDLHRLELIKRLGFKVPMDFGEEQLLWEELSGFFTQAADLDPDRPIKEPE